MNFPMDHTCWIAAGGGCFVAAAAWSGDFTLVLYLALDILKHVFNVYYSRYSQFILIEYLFLGFTWF